MPDESLQAAGAELAAQMTNAERVASWVRDGTPTAEPVTTETPAETTPAATPVQPRGPDGKFLPLEPPPTDLSATPTPAAEASAPSSPPAGATAQQIQEFIEARLGESETFKIPKGVKLPLKRGDTIEYATVEELQARGMMELDYRHKTADLARQRREAQDGTARLEADRARVAAREQWLKEREDEMVAAQKDPESWAAFQQMQEMYRTNPTFRARMDDALAKRETEAELAVYRQREDEQVRNEAVQMAAGWIEQMATEFPGVDPERVRTLYADGLVLGRAKLDPADVRAIYQQEARYATAAVGPLQQQLAALKAQIDALSGAKAAEQHNATTQHALTRAKAPVTAPAGRPPVANPPEPGRFHIRDLPERTQQWIKG